MTKSINHILKEHSQNIQHTLKGVNKAGFIWNQVATIKERKHTQGIFVKEEKDKKPTLIIYIDSSALLQDYQTNHLLYEAKLKQAGFEVDQIIFKLSNKINNKKEEITKTKKNKENLIDIQLTQQDQQYIKKTTSQLSEKLQENVKKAFQSLRKQEINEKHNI